MRTTTALLLLLAACGVPARINDLCVDRAYEDKDTAHYVATADVDVDAADTDVVLIRPHDQDGPLPEHRGARAEWTRDNPPVTRVTAQLYVDGEQVDEVAVDLPWPAAHLERVRVCASGR